MGICGSTTVGPRHQLRVPVPRRFGYLSLVLAKSYLICPVPFEYRGADESVDNILI